MMKEQLVALPVSKAGPDEEKAGQASFRIMIGRGRCFF